VTGRLYLDTPVTYLKGVGPARAEALRRLGIVTAGDLLFHVPHRYEDASTVSPIKSLEPGMNGTIVGTVISKGVIPTRKGLRIFQAVVRDETGMIEVSWPGQPFLDRSIDKGDVLLVTGNVRIDPLFQPHAPARAVGAHVTFEPGARTAWHTHPLGQTLIVTSGCGRAQHWGGPIEELRPGDVVWFPAGEKHWHGAAPSTAMTHIAIQEQLEGKAVDWLEKVSDEQYRA